MTEIERTSSNPMSIRDTAANDWRPAAGDDQVIAMFETRARAEAAVDELVKSGVARESVRVVDRDLTEGREVLDVPVEDRHSGFWGTIRNLFMPEEDRHAYGEALRRGHVMVVVHPRPGEHEHVVHALERLDPVDFDARLEEWRSAGWNGIYDAGPAYEPERLGSVRGGQMGSVSTAAPGVTPTDMNTGAIAGGIPPADRVPGTAAADRRVATDRMTERMTESTRPVVDKTVADAPALGETRTGAMASGMTGGEARLGATRTAAEGESIPLAEEELRIGKRAVDRGSMRVRTYVVERPVEEEVRLREERLRLERHPTDRPIGAGEDAFRERNIEVSATGEEPVVQKEARVREEVSIRKEGTERTETVRDTVRRTELDVDENGKHRDGTHRDV